MSDEAVPEVEPVHVKKFKKGDKLRHVSYPEGVYAEVVERHPSKNEYELWAYGLEDTPVVFTVNEETGGLGDEWLPFEE